MSSGCTICVTNQKGGVGKTTTAGAIFDYLCHRSIPAVALDMDTQANLSGSHPSAKVAGYAHDVARGNVKTLAQGSIYAADRDGLVRLRNDLTSGRVRAGELMRTLASDDDVVKVIDTPPATDALNMVSLIASDFVVIPMGAEKYAIEGIRDELALIRSAERASGRSWDGRIGVLFTNYFHQTSLHRQLGDQIAESLADMGVKVFRQRIRHGIAIPEAQAAGKSLFDRRGVLLGPIVQYRYFCEELCSWCGIG